MAIAMNRALHFSITIGLYVSLKVVLAADYEPGAYLLQHKLINVLFLQDLSFYHCLNNQFGVYAVVPYGWSDTSGTPIFRTAEFSLTRLSLAQWHKKTDKMATKLMSNSKIHYIQIINEL